MSRETSDQFVALLAVYLWRNEPEKAASGVWFGPVEDEMFGMVRAYHNRGFKGQRICHEHTLS